MRLDSPRSMKLEGSPAIMILKFRPTARLGPPPPRDSEFSCREFFIGEFAHLGYNGQQTFTASCPSDVRVYGYSRNSQAC